MFIYVHWTILIDIFLLLKQFLSKGLEISYKTSLFLTNYFIMVMISIITNMDKKKRGMRRGKSFCPYQWVYSKLVNGKWKKTHKKLQGKLESQKAPLICYLLSTVTKTCKTHQNINNFLWFYSAYCIFFQTEN